MTNYEINRETLAIIPIDENTSKVIEMEREFIVYNNIMSIIDNSCRYFGSSYNGRFLGTKRLMGISHKSPIIIEETSKMIFFPTTSPRIGKCAWISLNNIKDYKKNYGNTIIYFSCGKDLELEISYGIIDNQILRASRLEMIITKRSENVLKK